ncbi:hypothetical protein QPK87_01355 [Kamptonema cortianum]|nr:hypothetical protein [Geitlerinema splendidum]MDK3155235.1 hypothetical protein [Kamptonema cortianum]
MKIRSKPLLFTSAFFVVAAAAVSAGTPCGKPVKATVYIGGTCVDPIFGGAYCTQYKKASDGKCEGQNEKFVCATGTRTYTYPYYVLGTPNNGCAGGCVESPNQTVQVTLTEAFATTEACVVVVDPGDPAN